MYHKVRIDYYPPRGDQKEGWDNIDIFGWLGYPMQIKIDFLCRDSILAAPIVLDLALFMDLAQRAGFSGIQEWLSFYFKSPMTAPGLYPENDLFIQLMKLKNMLRWMKGEEPDHPPRATSTTTDSRRQLLMRAGEAVCALPKPVRAVSWTGGARDLAPRGHAGVIDLAALGGSVGHAVIDAGAHERQAPGHIHRTAPVEQLGGDRGLVVDHRDHAIELAALARCETLSRPGSARAAARPCRR